jgi:hypothetical protein
VVVTTLNTNTTGQMDITNGSMVIRGPTPAAVTAQITSGFNGVERRRDQQLGRGRRRQRRHRHRLRQQRRLRRE